MWNQSWLWLKSSFGRPYVTRMWKGVLLKDTSSSVPVQVLARR
ncbi:MAG: hypothetical protein AAFY11_04250 [Cyanobacteria bacterium J06641_5]